jgi:hypothetical protein
MHYEFHSERLESYSWYGIHQKLPELGVVLRSGATASAVVRTCVTEISGVDAGQLEMLEAGGQDRGVIPSIIVRMEQV